MTYFHRHISPKHHHDTLLKELVQTTWKVVPIADTAADLFYGKPFELDPALRPMFPTDLSE